MRNASDVIGLIVVIVPWIIGLVLAKGFWSTFFAAMVPPYGWYLFTEWLMLRAGWV